MNVPRGYTEVQIDVDSPKFGGNKYSVEPISDFEIIRNLKVYKVNVQ